MHLSTVRFIREVLPHMKRGAWGRILAIQSSSVKQPVEGLILSNGIRPGVAGLFKTLSGDLAKDGITVNLVLPGRIMTDRFIEHQTDRARRAGLTLEQQMTRRRQRHSGGTHRHAGGVRQHGGLPRLRTGIVRDRLGASRWTGV